MQRHSFTVRVLGFPSLFHSPSPCSTNSLSSYSTLVSGNSLRAIGFWLRALDAFLSSCRLLPGIAFRKIRCIFKAATVMHVHLPKYSTLCLSLSLYLSLSLSFSIYLSLCSLSIYLYLSIYLSITRSQARQATRVGRRHSS
jgi:hypothetical protein